MIIIFSEKDSKKICELSELKNLIADCDKQLKIYKIEKTHTDAKGKKAETEAIGPRN